MNRKLAALVAGAIAVAAIPAASGRGAAGDQRVAFVSQSSLATFASTPLHRGALKRDHGSVSWGAPAQRFVSRNGQSIEVNELSAVFYGARGSLVTRFRIEWTNAGHGYDVGAGRWTVVRGSGAYKNLVGGGRSSSVWPPNGDVKWRAEGVLRPR